MFFNSSSKRIMNTILLFILQFNIIKVGLGQGEGASIIHRHGSIRIENVWQTFAIYTGDGCLM